jgi:hypothetical protein
MGASFSTQNYTGLLMSHSTARWNSTLMLRQSSHKCVYGYVRCKMSFKEMVVIINYIMNYYQRIWKACEQKFMIKYLVIPSTQRTTLFTNQIRYSGRPKLFEVLTLF